MLELPNMRGIHSYSVNINSSLEALLIQFYRVANIYFLVIAILQTIPQISPYTPVTAWLPLIVVLGISMLREGYEDFGRHQEDNMMNYQSKTLVRRNGAF